MDDQTAALTGMTLDELSAQANSEARKVQEAHNDVAEAMSRGLVHAIRSGEACIEAQSRVEPRKWGAWVKSNLELDPRTLQKYMRFAHFKSVLMDSEERLTTMSAEVVLRGLPVARDNNRKIRLAPETLAEIDRLAAETLNIAEIARLVGVSHAGVKAHLNPAWRKQRTVKQRENAARRRLAAAALAEKERRQERDRIVKRAGGSASEAYALVRKASSALDRALSDAGSAEEREQLRAALAATHKAEDGIVDALKIERQEAA